MKSEKPDRWNLSYRATVALQKRLAAKVSLRSAVGRLRYVAGVDVSYAVKPDAMYAGVVVLDAKDMSVVERRGAVRKARFPYIPGLLSFRETPSILAAIRKLKTRPGCIIVDGHGIAHPRRFGIASHLGVILGIPTIGCAKSVLVGEHGEVGRARGAWAALKYENRVIGRALRTREGVKPVFVSPGHKVSFSRAAQIVLRCCTRYRLPDTTRLAHQFVNEMRGGRISVT